MRGAKIYGTDGSEHASDENYLSRGFGAESVKVVAALSLMDVFDLRSYKEILEIRCGDIIQALVIKHRYPNVAYLATDFDPYMIQQCAKLTPLNPIRKGVLDIMSLSVDDERLRQFDLIISWGVDYTLQDNQLLRLLEAIQSSGASYLMCSGTLIGPAKFVYSLARTAKMNRLLRSGLVREQGWQRSIGRFRRFAKYAGMNVRILGMHGFYFCLLFESKRNKTQRNKAIAV